MNIRLLCILHTQHYDCMWDAIELSHMTPSYELQFWIGQYFPPRV